MMQRTSGGLRAGLALVATIAAFVTVVGLAVASSPTLKGSNNATLGKPIVVDSKGRTVYELKGETAHHLLCNSKSCFSVWPPVKVSKTAKITKGPAVHGKIGKIHRNGFYQVTLGGLPLYYFSGDHGSGSVAGNGFKSFGGTWHVIGASPNYGGY